MRLGGVGRSVGQRCAAMAAITLALAAGAWAARPAEAAPFLPLFGNPVPLTDLVASTFPIGTGGTQRICATSGLGIAVHCVDNVNVMPSASPTASGVTFGHWIFCKTACVGSLLRHEMVHVTQFEGIGDTFGPMYLLEAAVHGTGCENQYERPAYQVNGGCR